MASLKKHIQQAHPELAPELNNSHNLESCCVIKKRTDDPSPDPPESIAEEEQKQKEPIKNISAALAPSTRPMINEIVYKPAPIETKSTPSEPISYNPISLTPKVIAPLAYANPMVRNIPNCELLYMLPFTGPHEGVNLNQMSMGLVPTSLSPSSTFWMQKLASPPENNIAQAAAFSPEDIRKQSLDEERKASSTENPILEARIRNLTTSITKSLGPHEHLHIHCEFCGHSMMKHGEHLDYIHDGELHCVSNTGLTPILIKFRHCLSS